MERSRRKSSKQTLEEKQLKRYFRAKKRSRHRDRSSSAKSQKDTILKEEVEVVHLQNKDATVRYSTECQQLKGKESQQHEPSVSKYNDIVNKLMETQKVIKRNEKET